jgi:hypothetical protein
MIKFRIGTHQHLVSEMWIYTPHVNSNPFNYKDTTLPVAVNIEIFDLDQECFSHLQSWYVLSQTPPHRIHDEHGIIRGNLSVYLEFLMGTCCSYARTLRKLFQALGGDTNHNEECQKLKSVLISSFICISLQILCHMHSLIINVS